MKKIRRRLIVALGGCMASVAAQAQTDDAVSESAYLDEMPIVLTVSRLPQRVDEAPAAVTVIDRQMIKDSGAWDLSEVFRLVPGMFVAYHASRTYMTDSLVSYHGLMSETMSSRMQVLVDGRSVYSPLFGGVIWSDIPVVLDDIERIEVVRGPDSASYGANSFMGVINIITRHSADTQGKLLSLSAGERGREDVTARYGARNGDLTWRITASLRNDKGEDTDIHTPTSSSFIWTKNKFDDKKIQQLSFRGDYQINLTDTLEFQFGYNGGPRQAGEVQDVVAPNKRANNYFTKLNWRRALDQGGELSVQYYDATESSTATLIQTDPGQPPLAANMNNGDVTARRQDLEVQHTFSPGKNTRIVWGGNVRHDTTFAPHDLGGGGLAIGGIPDRYDIFGYSLTSLFGNVEWRPLQNLLFNLGAMSETNSYTGTALSPRIAANWHFLPGHTLRIGYAEATRTPTVFEKRWEEYQRQTVNPRLPSLLSEHVKAYDLGYLGKFRNLDVDFRLFHEQYTDLIAEHRNDAAIHGNLNSGRATVKGFETQLKWDISKQTRLIYGLSHAVVDSPNVDRIPYTNSVPTNNQSLMLTHSINSGWRVSLVGFQTGETHFDRTDFDPTQNRDYFIPTQRRWDGRVAYSFQAGKGKGELALNVQNLAGAEYYEFRHDNQALGRTAWLNLRLETD